MRATLSKITQAATALALASLAACGGGAPENARQSNAGAQAPAQSNAQVGAPASNVDIAKLNSDIERLEKAAERNPADEDTRDELARAYVGRGDAERAENQLQEALKDYQRALRLDPDNGEAQKNAYDIQGQLGGEQQDENGAPAPAPITPNVADDEDKPAPKPSEKPTPKKQ
ncbi:MAG TPA: tetratricopeptide repeat protein [Pyrinomonadaceae bacterium]|jgi:tetratricopeptide (TPR) repeat protein|nr:tetratricopeptide repeat protein [Pyrinomonadaceae bacterium]